MPNAIQSLWQHQEPELREMSTGEVRRRADQAFSEDRKHSWTGLITAGILVVCFGVFFVVSPTPIGRVGGVVGMSAGISLAYRAYRLEKSHPLLPSAAGIEAYRRILDREQKALAICWHTMLLVQLGVALQFLGDPEPVARRAVIAVATIAPVIVVAVLTRAKSRAYGRRARELDRFEGA